MNYRCKLLLLLAAATLLCVELGAAMDTRTRDQKVAREGLQKARLQHLLQQLQELYADQDSDADSGTLSKKDYDGFAGGMFG